jgi:hypothetical protein
MSRIAKKEQDIKQWVQENKPSVEDIHARFKFDYEALTFALLEINDESYQIAAKAVQKDRSIKERVEEYYENFFYFRLFFDTSFQTAKDIFLINKDYLNHAFDEILKDNLEENTFYLISLKNINPWVERRLQVDLKNVQIIYDKQLRELAMIFESNIKRGRVEFKYASDEKLFWYFKLDQFTEINHNNVKELNAFFTQHRHDLPDKLNFTLVGDFTESDFIFSLDVQRIIRIHRFESEPAYKENLLSRVRKYMADEGKEALIDTIVQAVYANTLPKEPAYSVDELFAKSISYIISFIATNTDVVSAKKTFLANKDSFILDFLHSDEENIKSFFISRIKIGILEIFQKNGIDDLSSVFKDSLYRDLYENFITTYRDRLNYLSEQNQAEYHTITNQDEKDAFLVVKGVELELQKHKRFSKF